MCRILFLLTFLFYVTKGLSTLLRKVESSGNIHGVAVCQNAPIMSHLLFAHDCFLFYRADVHTNILTTYVQASGQVVNFQKSEVLFSRNVQNQLKDDIASVLDVNVTLCIEKYLELPSMIGRSKKPVFNFIKDIVWQKLNFWSIKTLLRCGIEVLVKSALQSIPTYMTSFFLLPQSL